MLYLFGAVGFIAGFYAGILMLKPALRRVSNKDLRTDKSLAWKVGWVPWVMALLGLGLAYLCYEYVFLSEIDFFA